MKKLLEVKNVTKIYKMYHSNIDRLKEIFLKKTYHREFVANKEISFDLFERETLGIIGVNGAGKSTILKIIAGVIAPTSGEVIRHGRVTALLELGTGFNEEMTGRQNILLNATLLGMTHKECHEKEDAIIEFSELGAYIDEPIKTYSSGMKMRLAFSIALFSEPQILIVDEALSVGDAHFGAKCTQALKERKEKNMAIIYVSHDLNSLKLLCDRVILLNQGMVAKEGEPEDVINSYNFLIAKQNDKEEKITIKNNQSSFGTFDATITKVTLTAQQTQTTTLHSGEDVTITVHIAAKKTQENMTVGILIKDKFGQDIFGTNTFYHKISCTFDANKHYLCNFTMPLNIGTGKYTITAAIHPNETHHQHCAHWLDYALDFEIVAPQKEYFIGLCRLEPKITLQST
ncbi:MAG TPA: ABC transporter ATP-binding protein [Sulfurimonas autotrophica]|nr:ABC transporter ATP-binding protein [Sulfurimonas autotrophica]